MKKTLIAFASLIAAAGFSVSAQAQSFKPVTFELGVTTHQERYEEFDDTGKIMQEKGMLFGFKGSMTRHFSERSRLTLAAEVASGDSDYTGSYMGGSYGDVVFKNLSRDMFELSTTYGHTFAELPNTSFTAGLAYRRLTDNLQEAGASGYKRINDLGYATLGVEHAFHANDWTISPGLRYKTLLWGEQYSDLLGGVTVDQNHGHGSDLYVNFFHKASKVVVSPYVRLWSMKDSEISPEGLYEPRNKTREVGVAVSYRF